MAHRAVHFGVEMPPHRHTTTTRYRITPHASSSSHPTPTSTPPDFLLCYEFTILLRSRHTRHPTANSLLEDLASKLSRGGFPVHLHARGALAPEDHRLWTLSTDHTLPHAPHPGQHPIKLTSPLFPFPCPPSTPNLLATLPLLFSLLHFDFKPTLVPACASHIHLVPSRGVWTLGEAKRLACAALYFEPVLDALVPPSRRRSVSAKSNRHNRYFGRRTVADGIQALRRHTDSFPALAARMNWCGASSATGVALRRTADFVHAGYRWNFADLDSDRAGAGTVEFRLPPGVLDARGAVGWAVLAGCFARLACGFELDAGVAPSLVNLGRWVRYEARNVGVPGQWVEYLREMFVEAEGAVVGLSTRERGKGGRDAERISGEEAVRLRWEEMVGWSAGREKFRAYMRYTGRGERVSKLA
ncbi:hypothetical protein QBC39DRAFT_355293 [Podospora conica]|nr:hypothetical protein QBC39DRAFT_355293 [Schizothecium conicum]